MESTLIQLGRRYRVQVKNEIIIGEVKAIIKDRNGNPETFVFYPDDSRDSMDLESSNFIRPELSDDDSTERRPWWRFW